MIDWLPAYTVFGEGIFLRLNEERLSAWEIQHEVLRRIETLSRSYDRLRQKRHYVEKNISPRFILMHTLSHLLMNRLIFECGYSSASLRERLYVSQEAGLSMSALLVYTAAGDADGSMGGLVRMG